MNTGINFPTASFGLQIYDDARATELTLIALEAGYRNFFASVLARNQKGFARAIKQSGIPREELFICGSVLSNQVQGYDKHGTETGEQRARAAPPRGGRTRGTTAGPQRAPVGGRRRGA